MNKMILFHFQLILLYLFPILKCSRTLRCYLRMMYIKWKALFPLRHRRHPHSLTHTLSHWAKTMSIFHNLPLKYHSRWAYVFYFAAQKQSKFSTEGAETPKKNRRWWAGGLIPAAPLIKKKIIIMRMIRSLCVIKQSFIKNYKSN